MQRLTKSMILNKRKYRFLKAQAIVEFAIALPILLMLLVGILEVGRMVFVYSAVNNASREAARYGSAFGLGDSGFHKYMHCAGIREMAKRSAWFLNLPDGNISVTYDGGPGTSQKGVCDATSGEDADLFDIIFTGDRVNITVTATYSPMVNLVPITSRTFTSTSSRTILGIVQLEP
jgi:Flp pilus assembly protein TadG